MNNCMQANWITDEMDIFLETQNQPLLNHEEI